MFLYIVGCIKFYEIMIKLIAFEASLWFEEKNVWCINKGTEKNNTGRERVLYLDGPLLQSPWATDSIQL